MVMSKIEGGQKEAGKKLRQSGCFAKQSSFRGGGFMIEGGDLSSSVWVSKWLCAELVTSAGGDVSTGCGGCSGLSTIVFGGQMNGCVNVCPCVVVY